MFEYKSPLSNRYGSDEIHEIFSDDNRYRTWRTLWYELARVEQEFGLNITDEQLEEMRSNIGNINYKLVKVFEKECKHDVMAHLKEFCTKCPTAEPIIHLGATSCYITDNADIIIMNEALHEIKSKIDILMELLTRFSRKYAGIATMAYTHLQPAQPTTVGKRGCMWLQDFVMDYEALNKLDLKLLGCNGATGTQASILELFNGDKLKVKMLNRALAYALLGNRDKYMLVSGQTYTRKVDSTVLDVLSGIAQSAHKMCNDIRLLQGMHEMSEPFRRKQVGSSAMAYKQNPIKCENVCSLSRHIISLTMTAKMNACTQWLERSLDDSANRRLIISEAFILTDHILEQCIEIVRGLTVNEGIIDRHIKDNIPYIAMENIIMEATKSGISRQEAHSRIRDLSVIATQNVLDGKDNNLLELIREDEVLGNIQIDIDIEKMIGMAKEQTEDYLSSVYIL